MPQGRGAKPKKKTTKSAEPAAEQEPINGVLVRLVPDGEGNQQVNVQALGETRLTEAPTILRLAAQSAEKQIGIE